MAFSPKVAVPFRLRLLLAMLAASGAGIYLSYAVFAKGLEPFSREEAGRSVIERLRTLAAVIGEDVKSGLAQARLTAGRTGIRELAAGLAGGGARPGDAAELQRRLNDATAASGAMTSAELAGKDGRVIASSRKGRTGAQLLQGRELAAALKSASVGAPRAEGGRIFYDVTVPVPGGADGGGPIGVLKARFTLSDTNRPSTAAQDGVTPGLDLALIRKDSKRLVFYGGGAPAFETGTRSAEGTRFLAALSGKPGVSGAAEDSSGSSVYGWVPVQEAGWVLAGTAPLPAAAGGSSGRLLDRVRLGALLAFLLLAVSSFFAASWLAAPLREAGRQAAELLEQCGEPPERSDSLYDPKALAAAIEEAARVLKSQSSRDLELESETEKLREEDADLKSQNDELEKLNKYLMEREVKISELKKEIIDLKEKVGSGAQE